MKKMVLGLFLVLATFGLFMSPAMAVADAPQTAPAPSAGDQAFLASLALPGAPTPAAHSSLGAAKALCSAAASCNDGTLVNCTGNNSTTSCSGADRNCSVGERGHVTCDGVTKWCATPCPVDCDQLEWNCSWSCNPCNYNFTCDPATGDWSCRCIFRNCPV
jgi:hypothetical protein